MAESEAGADAFEIHPDEFGSLVLKRPGLEDVKDVRVRRAFPWSAPDRFLSIRTPDGKELVLVEDPGTLSPATRDLIHSHLVTGSFIPKIQRIESVDTTFGYQQWKVVTDRGPTEFRVQEREDVRFLPDGRFSVKDADGNVYEMGRLDALDDESRRALESLL